MNGRIRLLALFLLAIPVCLAGCTGGDDDEYRVYSPENDQPAAETVESAETDVSPSPAADAAQLTGDELPPIEAPDTAVVSSDAEPPADMPEEAADAAPAETPAARNGLALTPEQQAELAAIAAQAPAEETPSEPREMKLLVPENSFKKEGPEGAIRVSYDDLDLLKVLNMEPVTPDAPQHFPSWLKDLDGKRIRLRGYMRPDVLAEDLPFFVLARDTQACCFGPNTKPYDIIPTIMREGVTTDYIHLQPFDIVGNFHINVEMDLDDPNKVEFLYYIDDAILIRK